METLKEGNEVHSWRDPRLLDTVAEQNLFLTYPTLQPSTQRTPRPLRSLQPLVAVGPPPAAVAGVAAGGVLGGSGWRGDGGRRPRRHGLAPRIFTADAARPPRHRSPPLARRADAASPRRSCSGSASAEPQAPVEEPHGTGRRGERGCRRHRRQEEERVGRAGSDGGAEEVRVQMHVQVQVRNFLEKEKFPLLFSTFIFFGLFLGEGEISRLVVANDDDDDDDAGSSKNVGAGWIFGGRIRDFFERLRREDTLRRRTEAHSAGDAGFPGHAWTRQSVVPRHYVWGRGAKLGRASWLHLSEILRGAGKARASSPHCKRPNKFIYRPCLGLTLKLFTSSHRTFEHMYEVLNID
uniref:Uncharacterized protein n=1 Tax=Oryza glumipatula TaxID=40148 RepID=A0A0D9ZI31_9ORYZ